MEKVLEVCRQEINAILLAKKYCRFGIIKLFEILLGFKAIPIITLRLSINMFGTDAQQC